MALRGLEDTPPMTRNYSKKMNEKSHRHNSAPPPPQHALRLKNFQPEVKLGLARRNRHEVWDCTATESCDDRLIR